MIKIQKDFLHRKDFTGYRYRRRDIDDAICLVYLLKEPQCELIGITTVCGEPEKRAAVADVDVYKRQVSFGVCHLCEQPVVGIIGILHRVPTRVRHRVHIASPVVVRHGSVYQMCIRDRSRKGAGPSATATVAHPIRTEEILLIEFPISCDILGGLGEVALAVAFAA